MGFEWVFNVWLYLMFVFNPQGYQQLVDAGAPCYALVELPFAGPGDPGPMPQCWYDPAPVVGPKSQPVERKARR